MWDQLHLFEELLQKMVNVYLDYILADKTKAITDEDSFAKTTNDPIINEVI